jgi:hypothetical protein
LSIVTSPEGFALTCHECGRVTILDAEAQRKILAELKLPAQRKIIDCSCGRYQWALAAGPKLPTAAEVATAKV